MVVKKKKKNGKMKGKCNRTSIRQSRTLNYTKELWEYYKTRNAVIFEWDEKKNKEPQLGIRIYQAQRIGFITPIDKF